MKPMKFTDKFHTCPVCKGRGELPHPYNLNDVVIKKEASKLLVDAGFSYREVARLIGYKSAASVMKNVKK